MSNTFVTGIIEEEDKNLNTRFKSILSNGRRGSNNTRNRLKTP